MGSRNHKVNNAGGKAVTTTADMDIEKQSSTPLEQHSPSRKKGVCASETEQENATVSDDMPTPTPAKEKINEKKTLQDQTNLLPFRQLILVFIGLGCAVFCSLLDQTIVSTALPTLGRAFHAASISSWVGTSYLLTSTACQPLYGRLSDIFGRKAILLGSMGLFLLGSILCAVSQSMIMLIVFRAVSGIGGGGIMTSAMIVTSDVVSLEKRGFYQGILGGVVALANSLGPLVGGAFSEKVSWRWCFYINIPLSSIAILVVAFVLPFKKVTGDIKGKLAKIDYVGCFFMITSAILILLALSWSGTSYPWNSAGSIAPLVIGGVLAAFFVIVEMKLVILPLIPMHIFKIPTVAGANIGAFFTGFMFYCNLFYLPQFYQVVRGVSPIRSGVLLLPLVLVQTVTSFTAGALVSKTGNYQLNLWVGFAIWTIALGLLSTVSPNISNAKLVGYQILNGIGAGQTFQTSLIAIQASVKRNEMAVATATRNFLRLLGGTISLAACAAILNNTTKNNLAGVISSDVINQIISDPTVIVSGGLGLTASETEAALQAYTTGIRNIYYFMIPLSGISFFVTLFLIKGHTLKRHDDAKLQEEGKKWVEENRHGIFKGKTENETSASASAPTEKKI